MIYFHSTICEIMYIHQLKRNLKQVYLSGLFVEKLVFQMLGVCFYFYLFYIHFISNQFVLPSTVQVLTQHKQVLQLVSI